jgi:hypothetical protein
MSVTQNLKSVVTLGGAVDSSFKGMAGTVDKQLGSATNKVKSLEREQSKLRKQIKKTKLAGGDVSSLSSQYEELSGEIAGAERQMRGFQAASELKSNLKGAASFATKVAAGVTGIAATVFGLTTATNAATAEQAGLAQAYGMTIEQYKAWGGIAGQVGFDEDTTGDLVEELSNKFGEFKALGEQSSVADVFGKLGIEAAMMNGLDAAEQFEFVMRRLEKVGDTQQAASLADMLFGGEGNKIVTYIKNSGQSLDQLLDKQKSINNLTQAGADGAVKYNRAWSSVTKSVSSAWQDVAGLVGGQVAPVFEQLGSTISAFVRENRTEIVDFLRGAVEGAMNLAGAVWDMGSAVNSGVEAIGGWQNVLTIISGFMAGKVVMSIGGLVSGISTMVSTLGTVRSVMLGVNAVMAANPIGAAALAVGLLVAGGIALYENWDKVKAWFEPFFGWFEEKWNNMLSLGQKAKDLFNSATSWMGFGDDDDDEETKQQSAVNTTRSRRRNRSRGTQTTDNEYNYASRAAAASEQTAPASSVSSTTIHQRVEKIEVVAAPGQSPEDVGRAVANELDDYHASMFDLSMSE